MGSSEIFIALNDGLMLSNIFEWEGKIGNTGVAGHASSFWVVTVTCPRIFVTRQETLSKP